MRFFICIFGTVKFSENMKILPFLLFLAAPFLYAQSSFKPHVSNFNMMSFTYKHNEKWQAYLELQMRSIEDFMLPNYYEVKGGIGYNLNKNNQLFVGTGRYGTYKESRLSQTEFRLWLQYVLSQKINVVKLDHRVRAEKRFFSYPQTDTKANDERFRYRLSATVPLNDKKITTGTVYANAFEELFFGPANSETFVFKRNRFYSGFGVQVNSFMNANMGYMWQIEYSKVKENRQYHFVYFALNFVLDRQKNYEYQPIPVAD